MEAWLDEMELHIGESLINRISEAIKMTDFFAIFLSQCSVNSSWVQKELGLAITSEIKGKTITVLPFLLEDCEVPFYLSDKLYADFRLKENFEEEFLKVLKSIGVTRQQW